MSPKKSEADWTADPDLRAARTRLALVATPGTADVLAGLLSAARPEYLAARDLLHAAQLPVLERRDPEVARILKRLAKGKPLRPVLLVRGDLAVGRPLFVADGYATASACCLLDADLQVACRLADLPKVPL